MSPPLPLSLFLLLFVLGALGKDGLFWGSAEAVGQLLAVLSGWVTKKQSRLRLHSLWSLLRVLAFSCCLFISFIYLFILTRQTPTPKSKARGRWKWNDWKTKVELEPVSSAGTIGQMNVWEHCGWTGVLSLPKSIKIPALLILHTRSGASILLPAALPPCEPWLLGKDQPLSAVPPSQGASGPPCKSQGSKSAQDCWQPCSERPLVRAGSPVQCFHISNILSLNTHCPNAYVINKGPRDSAFWCNYIAPYHYFS